MSEEVAYAGLLQLFFFFFLQSELSCSLWAQLALAFLCLRPTACAVGLQEKRCEKQVGQADDLIQHDLGSVWIWMGRIVSDES